MGDEKFIVATSGYFDPLHVGHLELIDHSRRLADENNGKLVVIVNNDEQARLKKGEVFMSQEDRTKIVAALKQVDEVFLSVDKDKSVCESLRAVKPNIFANGGDRTEGEIPETPVCKEVGIEIIDGLGEKIRSSSEIIGRIKEVEEKRKEFTKPS